MSMNSSSVRVINQLLASPEHGEAWAKFLERYECAIRTCCCHALRGRSDVDVDGVCQEVLLQAYFAFRDGKYKDQGSFRAWLREVCVHRSLDAIKKANRRLDVGQGGSDAYERLNEVGSTPDESFAEELARAEVLDRALAEAREKFGENSPTWQAFALTQNGMKQAEAAEKLGTTENSVKQLRHRVLARLRDAVETLRGRKEGQP